MILSSFLQFRRGKVRLIQAKLYYLPILVCELLTHMNKALYPTISVITASILLMWFTFYNGYPMATSDTGAYVRFAFDFQVLKDRSSFYSIWVAVAGLRSSLWLPVFFQCLLLAMLFLRYYQMLSNGTAVKYHQYLAAIVLVAFTTGVSFIAAYIMPDIFAGMLLLSVLLYLYDDKASAALKLLYLCLAGFSILVHNSHFLIVPAFCVLALVYVQLTKQYHLRLKIVKVLGVAASCWLLVCSINFVYGFGFTLSPGSHVFMAGKLVETGTMKKYLDEQCAEQPYKLCAYKDQLPQRAYEYIWDENGAFKKTGGWDSSAAEHKAIIRDVFTTPEYALHFAGVALQHTWQQLMFIHILQEDQAFKEGSPPYDNIEREIKSELGQFRDARQQQHTFNNSSWIKIQLVVLILTMVWVSFLFVKRVFPRYVLHIYILLLLFIICNAFVTASFANVLERLQNRVFWVLPATNILVLSAYYAGRLATRRN